jgi:multisubunit Na+/H+ antiporter MnhB subunit
MAIWVNLVLPIFAIFFAIRRWRRRRGTTFYLHPWVERGVVAGAVFGGCFANTFAPIWGIAQGVVLGTLTGGLGGVVVASSMRLQQRRGLVDPKFLERSATAISLGLIALGLLFGFWYFGRNFDAPVSKYVSEGEYVRMFYSDVVWPTVLLAIYLLLAGPPSSDHCLVGETSKGRRVAIQVLILLAALSSIYIGGYWLSDNFRGRD